MLGKTGKERINLRDKHDPEAERQKTMGGGDSSPKAIKKTKQALKYDRAWPKRRVHSKRQ